MKYIKTLDFFGQTLIFCIYAITVVVLLLTTPKTNEMALATASGLFCIGCWQMLSATLMLMLKAPELPQRHMHFLASIIYLAFLFISISILNAIDTNSFSIVFRWLLATLAISIPIGLSIFYYIITWRFMFPAKPVGRFLPNISF
jgi:hypothetical protein